MIDSDLKTVIPINNVKIKPSIVKGYYNLICILVERENRVNTIDVMMNNK